MKNILKLAILPIIAFTPNIVNAFETIELQTSTDAVYKLDDDNIKHVLRQFYIPELGKVCVQADYHSDLDCFKVDNYEKPSETVTVTVQARKLSNQTKRRNNIISFFNVIGAENVSCVYSFLDSKISCN